MNTPGTKDDKDKAFPPGFEHIDEIVRGAQERTQQIDEQIKNVPNDRGPSLDYTPPGFLKSRQMGNQTFVKNALEKQKADVAREAYGEVDKALQKADPNQASQVRNIAYNKLYPGSRDMDVSQNHMDSVLKHGRATKQEKVAEKPSSPEPPKEEKNPFAPSTQFLQPLHVRAEQASPTPDKSSGPKKDKGDKDRD